MVDVNGKEIKEGMCVELEYYTGGGLGVIICEQHGELGFMDGYLTQEFFPLSTIRFGETVACIRITKE